MQGRTWEDIEDSTAEEIKSFLLQKGGKEKEVKGDYEKWRIRFSDSTFTFYKKGTLYSTPSKSSDPSIFDTWKYIDSLVGHAYESPTKDFLLGFDETGKVS